MQAALEDEDFTEAEDGVQEEEERAEAVDERIAEQPADKPAALVTTASAHVRDCSTAEAEQAAAAKENAQADAQADSQPLASEPASSVPAPVPAAAASAAVKAASAPVTPATAGAEQDLEAPDAKAAAFAAAGSAAAAPRPSSAPTRRLERKGSPAPTPTEQASSKDSPALTKPASPENSSAPAPAKGASPKGSPASTPRRRLSPGSTPVFIPLGKAAEQNGGPSPPKRAKQSPPEPVAAASAPAGAGPRGAAATPAAQARAAKLTKRTKEPAKLQLDSVHRRRLTRAGATAGAKQSSASPPQQHELAQAPAQQMAAPPAQPGKAEQPAHEAAGSAPTRPPAVAAAEDKPEQAAVVAAKTMPLEKRGSGPMAHLLDKPKAPSPKVTAITAPRPIAAPEHRLSRLTDSSQESALTGLTPKVEESPEAVEERRQLQQQQEQERKAREHQKVLKQVPSLSPVILQSSSASHFARQGLRGNFSMWYCPPASVGQVQHVRWPSARSCKGAGCVPVPLKSVLAGVLPRSCHNARCVVILQSLGLRLHGWLQIEAGLDKASTGHSFIRDMTVLVLGSAAQGLEPRIVRSILERIEQARPASCGSAL